jgi:hypothetical protein
MVLGSTQPLTEWSTRNIPGGEGQPARMGENFTAICELIVYKIWEPRPFIIFGPPRPVRGIALLLSGFALGPSF